MMSVPQRVIAAAACLVLAANAGAQSIERERSSQRPALDKMEGEPLPEGSLDALKDWNRSETISDAIASGKIVVIGVVSMLEPKSWLTLSKLARMEEDFADRGVYVAAVHSDLGWDKMREMVESGEVTIPVARDEFGILGRTLRADDYPDLYVIDAGGDLRYADVHTGSLRAAIERLLRAPGTARNNAPSAARNPGTDPGTSAGSDSTTDGTPGGDPVGEPVFVDADASAYDSADWYPRPRATPNAINDLHGEPLPLELGENEEWISGETELGNRATLIFFWSDYCGFPCRKSHPLIQAIHDAHKSKLAVVGVGVQGSPDKFREKVEGLSQTYPQMYDQDAVLFDAIGIRKVPHALLISTDGVVRWQGNPFNSDLDKAARRLVAVDPGIGG